MKNQKFIAIICGVLLCILMIASDYHGYTTERSVVEFKGEVFEMINFMATHGRGLICAPILEKRTRHKYTYRI